MRNEELSKFQQDFSRFPNVSPLRIDIILELYITYKNDNKTNNWIELKMVHSRPGGLIHHYRSDYCSSIDTPTRRILPIFLAMQCEAPKFDICLSHCVASEGSVFKLNDHPDKRYFRLQMTPMYIGWLVIHNLASFY